MTIWDWCAWGLLLLWLRRSAPAWFGLLRPQHLRSIPPLDAPQPPRISIIVPARDEILAIEAALRSMLALDYPDLEVVAINDRSTDGTGEVMDRLAAENPRLTVVHVRELPAGWLGKNHAMHLGAQAAKGDFLLFTDGDILYEGSVLRRAMQLVEDRRLDHLVLLPQVLTETFGEKLIVNFFSVMLLIASEAAFARFSRMRGAYLGVGAFNLVRRTTYEQFEGHVPLRMEVADDMCLGKLMKHAGGRQDVYLANELLRVKWQHGGLWGIVRGLEKNMFAAMHFSVPRALIGCAALSLIMIVVPMLAFFPWSPMGLRIIALSNLLLFAVSAYLHGFPVLAGILYPAGGVVFIVIVLRSMWVTLRNRGIRWRDTFYPLEELRAGKV
ncbi:glycosyltransferase [Planctomyces sp. SH-PL14]|uniref:glycosyltransferase n=1 Tax=Planctomyces sp. SH-PL14 TaxID=1632864 RepID=UPI00078CFC9B|nr:glycosyltransferase [Planctomyces sp. SH-PL14]AMV21985.1 Poly-beta-1,6-N-acetyl-D-glucosamine synthase [Planctomyces sp. SH-PL14]